MNVLVNPLNYRWVRARDGLVAGVCSGLGRRFNIEPWVVRLFWLALVAALGTGLLLYLVLAVSLPREDRLAEAQERRILGVCGRISRVTDMEVGLVRTLAILLALASFGFTVIVYIVLYFTLPDARRGQDLVL